ncbi:MAG: hypothetical protein ACK583_01780 [Cyanobacteriota bacterium]
MIEKLLAALEPEQSLNNSQQPQMRLPCRFAANSYNTYIRATRPVKSNPTEWCPTVILDCLVMPQKLFDT